MTLFKYFRNNSKIKYRLEKIKDIIKEYEIPKCQRHIDLERLNVMENKFKENFHPITPIYVCKFENKRWIIDGQHRLEFYKMYKELHNEKIPIVEIHTTSEEEVNDYFLIVNDQLRLENVYRIKQDLRDIVLHTADYFYKKYPKSFHNKTRYKKAYSPYMWDDIFMEQLKDLITDEEKDIIIKLDIQNSDDFIKRLEDLNIELSKQNANFFQKSEKTLQRVKKNNMLYFGLIKEKWMDSIFEVERPEYDGPLTNTMRFACWNEYIGMDKGSSNCWCCNRSKIYQQQFQAGHIKAKAVGGKNTVKNLRPICSKCNQEMGTKNMLQFMKEMEYNHQES